MRFDVQNDRLVVNGQPAAFMPTRHQGGRIEATGILLHDTASGLKRGASRDYLISNPRSVSAHIVVERDGSVTQLADFDRKCNHAGASSWRGRKFCNGFFVGIEIVSPGLLLPRGAEGVAWFGQRWPREELVEIDSTPHGGRGLWLPYSQEQIVAVERIVQALLAAYPRIVDVCGHFEVSPGRKVDVGPQFPLARFKSMAGKRADTVLDAVTMRAAQKRLVALGYRPGMNVDGYDGPMTRGAVRDFQDQHDLPETGEIDIQTLEILHGEDAKPAPLGARETVTAGDLKGSATISGAAAAKRGVEAASAVTVAAAVAAADAPADPIGAAGGIVTAVEAGKGLGERIVALADWAASPKGLAVAAVLLALALVWGAAHRVQWRRVLKARLGLDTGANP